MAMTKKSSQDYLKDSFGQIDEGIRSVTAGNGLIVGGVFEGTATAIENADFGILHFDANQNLMVNLAGTEPVIVQIGTIATGTIGVVSSVSNLVAGTLNTLGTVGVLNGGTVSVVPLNSVASAKATIVVTTPAAAGTLACPITGLSRYITQVSPDLEATGTVTTTLVDSSGGTVMNLAAQVEAVITNYGTIVPLTSDMSFVSTCNGTQSANRSVILNIHYEK